MGNLNFIFLLKFFIFKFLSIIALSIPIVFGFEPAQAKYTGQEGDTAADKASLMEDLEAETAAQPQQTYDQRDAFCQWNCKNEVARAASCYSDCMDQYIRQQKKNNHPTAADNAYSVCLPKLEELANICKSNGSDAMNSCDAKQNSQLTQTNQAITQLSQQMGSSVQGACSTMAQISGAANAAVVAYQISCQGSIDSCNSSCHSALQFYKNNNGCMYAVSSSSITASDPILDSINNSLTSCKALMAKAGQAQQSIQSLMSSMNQAGNCAQQANGTGSQIPEMCKSNPSLPGCNHAQVNCSSPAMANDKVCICSRSPNNPICLNMNSVGNGVVPSSGGANPTNPEVHGKSGSDPFGGGDMFGLPRLVHGLVNSGHNDPVIDGKQGRGANLGGDSGGAGSGRGGSSSGGGGGRPGERAAVSVNSGFYSGNGGANGGMSGSFGNSYGGIKNSASADNLQNIKDLNLRQFLPGGIHDPKRGIAGAGLSGATGLDGITGPNSDVWQKIKNRYNVLLPTLIP